MELLEECGDAKKHVMTTTAVSDELLCGMRVVLANTTDVERFFDVRRRSSEGCGFGFQGGEQPSVATPPQAARGRARPPYRHSKTQFCCRLATDFELAAFQTQAWGFR
jgi:hypothetical protein